MNKNNYILVGFFAVVVVLAGWFFNKNWNGSISETKKLSSIIPDAMPTCTKDGREVLSYSIEMNIKDTPELKNLAMSALRLDPVNFEDNKIVSIAGTYLDPQAGSASYASYPNSGGGGANFEIEMNTDGSTKRFRLANVSITIESAVWQSVDGSDSVTLQTVQNIVQLAQNMKERCN